MARGSARRLARHGTRRDQTSAARQPPGAENKWRHRRAWPSAADCALPCASFFSATTCLCMRRYAELAISHAAAYGDDEDPAASRSGDRASRAEMARRILAELDSISRFAAEIGHEMGSREPRPAGGGAAGLATDVAPLVARLRGAVRAAWAPAGSVAAGGFRTRGMAGGGAASAAGEGAGAKGVSLAREVSQVVNMAAFKAAFKRKG